MFEKVDAPRWLHRFIIGRKGQNVRKITQDLPKVHVEFNDEEEVVSLEGPPAEVAQAKEAFETFTRDLVSFQKRTIRVRMYLYHLCNRWLQWTLLRCILTLAITVTSLAKMELMVSAC